MTQAPILPQKTLVHLEDGVITGLAMNKTFLKEFPFLAGIQQAAKPGKGCNRCGANRQRYAAMLAAKRSFAGLASDKKRRLKELLNTKQVRVTYLDARNKAIVLTF
jgi:hypothetical protein